MRFSDLIRAGAKLGPQYFGGMFGRNGDSFCAMGAAYRAIHGDKPTRVACLENGGSWIQAEHMSLLQSSEVCPMCKLAQPSTSHVITHMNDDHRMSREAIAEWVETIEAKLESSGMAAIERKQEETTSDTSAPVSTRQIESVHSSV